MAKTGHFIPKSANAGENWKKYNKLNWRRYIFLLIDCETLTPNVMLFKCHKQTNKQTNKQMSIIAIFTAGIHSSKTLHLKERGNFIEATSINL
jgi:hypothetical protein